MHPNTILTYDTHYSVNAVTVLGTTSQQFALQTGGLQFHRREGFQSQLKKGGLPVTEQLISTVKLSWN